MFIDTVPPIMHLARPDDQALTVDCHAVVIPLHQVSLAVVLKRPLLLLCQRSRRKESLSQKKHTSGDFHIQSPGRESQARGSLRERLDGEGWWKGSSDERHGTGTKIYRNRIMVRFIRVCSRLARMWIKRHIGAR